LIVSKLLFNLKLAHFFSQCLKCTKNISNFNIHKFDVNNVCHGCLFVCVRTLCTTKSSFRWNQQHIIALLAFNQTILNNVEMDIITIHMLEMVKTSLLHFQPVGLYIDISLNYIVW